jgi:hypothetical protein
MPNDPHTVTGAKPNLHKQSEMLTDAIWGPHPSQFTIIVYRDAVESPK